MITSNPNSFAGVDTAVFTRNCEILGDSLGSVDLSADAFGHGAVRIAEAALSAGISHFSVGRLDERNELLAQLPQLNVSVAATKPVDVLACYGLNANASSELQPVMTLHAQVLAVKAIERGGGVSYGYTWKAPEDGWLALVGLGYGDGFNRAFGNRISAHRGYSAFPAVGRVAMDAHSIWTGSTQLNVGDSVVYFGIDGDRVHPASSLADVLGCSPMAITSNLGTRVSRECPA